MTQSLLVSNKSAPEWCESGCVCFIFTSIQLEGFIYQEQL